MNNKAKNTPIYKYTIYDKLNSLTINEKQKALITLPEKLGISKDQFNKYLYAKVDSNTELTAKSMRIIAQYFSCTMEQLFTPVKELNKNSSSTNYPFLK